MDIYEYFNDSIVLCKIKRNEGSFLKVSFNEKSRKYIYKTYSSVDFSQILSKGITSGGFESYLNAKKILFYKEMQTFDSSKKILKVKYFEKKGHETMQSDMLIIYKYFINHEP